MYSHSARRGSPKSACTYESVAPVIKYLKTSRWRNTTEKSANCQKVVPVVLSQCPISGTSYKQWDTRWRGRKRLLRSIFLRLDQSTFLQRICNCGSAISQTFIFKTNLIKRASKRACRPIINYSQGLVGKTSLIR